MTLRLGSLFSGIDGLALGVQCATLARVAWHSEIDPQGSQILSRHWRAPNLGDVTRVRWDAVEPVDILVGGFPCQDISQAVPRSDRAVGEGRRPAGATHSRLNPDFVEWMMGFPPGWTAGVSRRARLRLLGNAVQPQVAEAAWRGLEVRL